MEINTSVNSINNKSLKSGSDQSLKSGSGTMLNHDAFLRLLISQMKHQDPTEPMKASEQVAQLAVFSQMEQSVKMNSNLQELLNSNNLAQATSYIGKDIVSSDGDLRGTVATVHVSSKGLTAITTENKEIPIKTGISLSG